MVNLIFKSQTAAKLTSLSGVAGLPCRNAPVFG
jgi:hypothetical protein